MNSTRFRSIEKDANSRVFAPYPNKKLFSISETATEISKIHEQWSRNAKERGLIILVDGWIACSTEIFDIHKAGEPMFLTTEDGNSGYLVVSMLQSLSLMEIKVLP